MTPYSEPNAPMVITVQCPSCSTAFPVDPAKVPEGGVHARCSECSAVFFVERPEEVVDRENEVSGPALADPAPSAPDEEGGAWADAREEAREAEEGEAAADRESADPDFAAAVADPAALSDGDGTPEAAAEERAEAIGLPVPEEWEVAVAAVEPGDEEAAEARTLDPEEPEPVEAPAGEAGEPWVTVEEQAPALDDSAGLAPEPPAAAAFDGALEGAPEESEPPAGSPDHRPSEPTPSPTADPGPAPRPFSFGRRDPHEKARRLARVLVSDMIMYNPDRHTRAIEAGSLKEDFDDEIRKSWQEYLDQVGDDIARGTSYFDDALNEILARGQRVFP